jgi:uncharacterized protein (AIM24 family)
MSAHEIDYQIFGEEMQYVSVELDPQETAIAEPGAFMMMEDGIQMETIFGDGTQQNSSILNKLFQAGKRALVGESLFMTAYTNTQYGKKKVSFASPYPGKIIPMFLPNLGGTVQIRHRLIWWGGIHYGKIRRRWHGFFTRLWPCNRKRFTTR